LRELGWQTWALLGVLLLMGVLAVWRLSRPVPPRAALPLLGAMEPDRPPTPTPTAVPPLTSDESKARRLRPR
jgi:hypothetical protein